ncbi:hypothetical protein [Desulfocastanea catecholica]
MSPEAYSWEVRESAEELYIIDGRTYEQVAETSGVSISQLKRWGLDSVPTWSERRREYRQAQTSVRRGVMLAKAKLIESVINTEDAQKAYAFSALVSSSKAIDEEARERNQQATVKTDPVHGEVVTDLPAALSEAIQRKIGLMLSAPGGVTVNSIKDVQSSLALLEKLQAKAGEGEDKDNRQLDSATIKALREQFGL